MFPFLKLKRYISHPNIIYLECYNKELYQDLASLGLRSNKTKNDSEGSFHFPNLREDLIPHFIRGYFDADGSAWYPNRKRSRNSLHIEFGCATPNFLKALDVALQKSGISFTSYSRTKKAGNGNYYLSYSLLSSNRALSLQFAEYIYSNATIYLHRKKETCYKPQDLRPTAVSQYGECPYCNGTHIQRAGLRGNKQRLHCQICNRRFTKVLNFNANLVSND